MKRPVLFLTLSAMLLFFDSAYSQRAYFVDGYHGGVYGHYPMWVTQFMLDKLAEHPEWKLGLEIEPETWDSVRLHDRPAYDHFRQVATDRRIEFTNPSYAQPYCYNISGESIIRQFSYGMAKMRTHFPQVTYSTYAAEEPCFTSSLPQILKQFGFKYAVLKTPNTCWGGYIRAYGGQLVNWIGPDGSSMLTVPRYASEELEENSTWQTTAWNNSRTFLQASAGSGIQNPVGMCYQDAGWRNGPWLGYGDNIKNNSIYVTWKEYFEEVSARQTKDNWVFSQEDILVNLMWGSQVLQRIGQQVRRAENNIAQAEKISAMAYIDKGYVPRPSDREEAWRTLMLAQHHDSWIVPYNRWNKKHTWAQAVETWTANTDKIAAAIVGEAMGSSGTDADPATNFGYIRVYNTVGASRTDVVSVRVPAPGKAKQIGLYDSANKAIPSRVELHGDSLHITFKPEVAGFGFSTYRLKQIKQRPGSKTGVHFDEQGNCIVENDRYRLVLDKAKGGTLKSLIAKQADDREFAPADTSYRLGEISGYFYDDKKFYSSTDQEARITVLEDHDFLIRVKVEGHIASHPFTQIITLGAGQQRIDFDLHIDWEGSVGIGEYRQEHKWTDDRRAYTDDRYKLKIMFPNSLHHPRLYKNAPFDVCESQQEDTFFGKWSDIKHNVILNWVDLSQEDQCYGLTVLSDHTTSYSYGKDYPLSLTAQYAGVGLWGVDYSISGPSQMRYALIPHSGRWDEARIPTQSALWNEPLIGVYHSDVAAEDKTYIQTGTSGFEISAVHPQEDRLILRLFNAEGGGDPQRVTFDFPVAQVQEILLNGDIVQDIPIVKHSGKSSVALAMPRFGLKTLSIKKLDYHKF